MPITLEQDGLFSRSFIKCDPIVPDEPMIRALNGFGSKLIYGTLAQFGYERARLVNPDAAI